MIPAPKPPCKLANADSMYSILFRVRNALNAAGFEQEAEEFLKRAPQCRCCEEMRELATEYVTIE
jgi:hypothetical protein